MSSSSLDSLCVNTIRTLSIDAVQKANSGHPGMPMGMADVAFVLWTRFLKHNPSNPDWFDRDRFILSAGHGSMLIYSLLYLTGYDLDLEDLKQFRQTGSKTPGHPEFGMTPGVETTTGPLGQGFATGIGMAMAERQLAATFNTDEHAPVDHFTYAIVSDGDLMEGVSHEAASMAGHLGLGKIVYLYDSNQISIEGSTDLAFSEDVKQRFIAYNWHVLEIDGHNHNEIEKAIESARDVTDRPSLIVCNTRIGFGSPNKEGSADSHGSPLGEEEVALTKKAYGWDPEKKFFVPQDVLDHFRKAVEKGKRWEDEWNTAFEAYRSAHPEKATDLVNRIDRVIPEALNDALPVFEADEKGMASRAASGKVINALKDVLPALTGGSADLGPSTKTDINGGGSFSKEDPTGRTFHFGVREFAMAAAVNGMVLHGGLIAYGATFFVFTDYLRPALRLAALMRIPSIFVMTHDSIGLGEDGPTHQPVEHLASLRAMPNVLVLRPGDANEVSQSWKLAIEHTSGPTVLVLTRQNIPTFMRDSGNDAALTAKGAYICRDSEKQTPDAVIVATGSELHLATEARDILLKDGIDARVVSMPSWELFRTQTREYRDLVLPPAVEKIVSVEAGSTFGWSEWVGSKGISLGIDRFGESGPYESLYEHFGITAEKIAEAVRSLN